MIELPSINSRRRRRRRRHLVRGEMHIYNLLDAGLFSLDNLASLILFIMVLKTSAVGHNNNLYHDHGHLRLTGVYSGIISRYMVVTPKQIFSNGTETEILLEHNLGLRNRGKRNVFDNGEIRIRLPLFGENQTLHIWPSYQFLSGDLEVLTKKPSLSVISYPLAKATVWCHYHGILQGFPKSLVAVSICNGLVGFIKNSRDEFWIEPSKNNISCPKFGGTHLLFRRSAVMKKFSKRKRKKRKKKKSCGTREPPQIVESRLAWSKKSGWLRIQGLAPRRSRHEVNRHHNIVGRRLIRRSVSEEHYVETLVVADSSVVDFYGSEDVELYLLSIMNMVSVMYKDPSIGNLINLVVVKIILLEDETLQGLNITVNADRTLDSFCRWQKSLNKLEGSKAIHHDVAILITRRDICSGSDTPCSTLGVAHVAGMCIPDRSCNVNEDNGITLAHTIAHELGHNFGMYHDSKKIGCSARNNSTLHIMTPSFEADTLQIAWSSCSRQDITLFLDGGFGRCLRNKPAIQIPSSYPKLPIGIIYDADYQCRLQFGTENSSVCVPLDEICSRLWCLVNNVCTTMMYPAAPGTSCGKHHWCEHQMCVEMEDRILIPVDGSWGKWSEWSSCSRTCGGGISISKRSCDNPPPSGSGKYCLGQRTLYRLCNTQDCPHLSSSFRAQQCSSYDNKTVKGKHGVTWLPYFETTEPCQLYCIDKDDTTIMPMRESALDGTPCNLGSKDMCISGLCRKIGCDWIVDSNTIEDKCGVCNGDGSKCTTMINYYNKTYGSGYTEIALVPKNARSIFIDEVEASKNYIAVGSTTSNLFYLNGNKAITLPGEYRIANSQALYTRQKEKDSLYIPGPVNEDIIIYLIFQGSYKNPGIRFEYSMRQLYKRNNNNYEWELTDWSACSATCGGGFQYAHPVCKSNQIGIINATTNYCQVELRPPKSMRMCNLQPCTHRWWTGPWQLCPITCGDFVLRRRTVLCISNVNAGLQMALSDSECADQPRPHHEEPCLNIPSCLSSASLFSSNNSNMMLSSVYHLANDTRSKNNKKFLHFKRKNFEQRSKLNWVILPWSQCSITCGLGFRKRTVYCPNHKICPSESKPIEVKQCFKIC